MATTAEYFKAQKELARLRETLGTIGFLSACAKNPLLQRINELVHDTRDAPNEPLCPGCGCPLSRCKAYGPGKKCCPDCNGTHQTAPDGET